MPSSPVTQYRTIILDLIAVRLHYSWQPITPIPLCWNLLEPRLFLISTSSTQAPSRGLLSYKRRTKRQALGATLTMIRPAVSGETRKPATKSYLIMELVYALKG